MRQKDPAVTASRALGLILHGVGAIEDERQARPSSQSAWYDRLREWGLPVSELYQVVKDVDGVRRVHRATTPSTGTTPPYEIDGVVVKLDQHRACSDAGLHQPRAALGDRLQVPAGGGHHQAAGHPGECRPDRQGDAVRA